MNSTYSFAQNNNEINWQDVAVRLSVQEPFSPFDLIFYEWKTRGSSPMVTWARIHVANFGRDDELSLVTSEIFQQWVEQLDVCLNLENLSSENNEHSENLDENASRITLEINVGYGANEIIFDPNNMSENENACVNLIRNNVLDMMQIPAYQNPFWREGEFGQIRIGCSSIARIYVDNVDTGENTPLTNYRVSEGQHEIRWVNEATGEERTETITVRSGQTTSIQVDME